MRPLQHGGFCLPFPIPVSPRNNVADNHGLVVKLFPFFELLLVAVQFVVFVQFPCAKFCLGKNELLAIALVLHLFIIYC